MKATATKAVAYIRVSTEQQATEGVSLDAQRARLEAWAAANGAELVAVHVDAGLSGGRADNRPGLQAALAEVCKLRGALVVYSLSRLARSTRDALVIAERLEKAGADLVSLSERIDTSGAVGKMMFRLLSVLNEFERDQISERTTTAMQHKAAAGEFCGGLPPYGWTVGADGVTLEAHDAEQAVIEMANELRAAGLSLRAVGEHLARRGLLPRTGRTWHPQSVKSLLREAAKVAA